MNRVETKILTTRKNLQSLMDLLGKWIDRSAQRRAFGKLILDLNPGAGSDRDLRTPGTLRLTCGGAAGEHRTVTPVVWLFSNFGSYSPRECVVPVTGFYPKNCSFRQPQLVVPRFEFLWPWIQCGWQVLGDFRVFPPALLY